MLYFEFSLIADEYVLLMKKLASYLLNKNKIIELYSKLFFLKYLYNIINYNFFR